MANWKCCNCNVEVEEVTDIKIYFNDLDLPDASGYRCPQCGKEWIDGEYVNDSLAAVEEMLEGK